MMEPEVIKRNFDFVLDCLVSSLDNKGKINFKGIEEQHNMGPYEGAAKLWRIRNKYGLTDAQRGMKKPKGVKAGKENGKENGKGEGEDQGQEDKLEEFVAAEDDDGEIDEVSDLDDVDEILDSSIRDGRLYFKVKWTNYTPKHRKWYAAILLDNQPQAIKDFYEQHPDAVREVPVPKRGRGRPRKVAKDSAE